MLNLVFYPFPGCPPLRNELYLPVAKPHMEGYRNSVAFRNDAFS